MLDSWNFLKGQTFFFQPSHVIHKEAHLNYKTVQTICSICGEEKVLNYV